MILFISDLIFLGLIYQIHNLSVPNLSKLDKVKVKFLHSSSLPVNTKGKLSLLKNSTFMGFYSVGQL